jgi:DnaJ-class molecular chaperone
LTEHPDKSKAANATEVFRKISKAYEVLMGNESKTLFDYYLDHPRVCFHDDDNDDSGDDSDSYDGIGDNDESLVSSSSDNK